MIVRHELTFFSQCPVNDDRDEYHLTVTARRLIKVEDILDAVAGLPAKAFQEALTIELAVKLNAEIETVGYHSGVKTTCRAG